MFFLLAGIGSQAEPDRQETLDMLVLPNPPLLQPTPMDQEKQTKLKNQINKYRVRESRLKTKNKSNGKARKHGHIPKEILLKELKPYLSATSHHIVTQQLKAHGRISAGYRWSDEIKSIGLQLKNDSSKAYRILRKIFRLPSIRTLNKVLYRIDKRPGFHPAVFRALNEKAKSLNNIDKVVVMAFDEMSLSENLSYDQTRDELEGFEDIETAKSQLLANHASVVMIRSISKTWKQPVGYFLTHSTMPAQVIKEKIIEGIRKVHSSGLEVKVIVLDQGSNNRAAYHVLGVTTDKPYFDVDGRRIMAFYDPPHLMKNVRNGWRRKGFFVEKEEVKWSHLAELYQIDSAEPIKMVPKLSRKHLDLPMFSTMSVTLATQVCTFEI